MNIYVASSCRTGEAVYKLVNALRHKLSASDTVYNFLEPKSGAVGFRWEEIDIDHAQWTHWAWLRALETPQAQRGFDRNFEAMRRADLCILLLPCGRSAHLEAGWCKGRCKKLFIYGKACVSAGSTPWEHDLMYKMADGLFDSQDALVAATVRLRGIQRSLLTVQRVLKDPYENPNWGRGGP